ncbi:hypothetical protein Taro_006027 [Colocasia esculenta]|uniref:Uncharacterized protein n=1 Tax=Colocasia esculenta TaxID=4460 RepID=A0A843TPV1_COLES|nr:hypothetical protein [Colocasia esculenta]
MCRRQIFEASFPVMSSSHKSFWNSNDARFSPNKMTMLNPNAAEFVPSALRYLPGNNKKVDVAKLEVPGTSRKAVLDQSAANVSSHSDEEAHQHWCHQLPDDITPDFKGMGEELQAPAGLSLAGFSINGATEASRFPLTMGSHPLGIHHERMPQGVEHKTLNQRIGCSGLSYSQDDPSIALMNLSATPLDKQFRKVDQHLTNDEECRYDGNLPSGFLDGFLSEHDGLEDAVVYPEEFLASRFPGFRSESLAELYYANGCNMNLTIDMLTQSSVYTESIIIMQ